MKLHLVTKTLSVRQTRRQSSCFHLGIGRLLFKGDRPLLHTTWVALLAIILLASCNRSAEHGFHSSEEVFDAYADFLQKVKNTENITTGRLVELVRKWYALDDSVASCIIRDSLTAHASAGLEIIHDSLRFYMGRLIDKRQWAFTDYLTIIESLNRVEVDTFSLPLVASAHRFYAGLDSVPTYGTNAEQTVVPVSEDARPDIKRRLSIQSGHYHLFARGRYGIPFLSGTSSCLWRYSTGRHHDPDRKSDTAYHRPLHEGAASIPQGRTGYPPDGTQQPPFAAKCPRLFGRDTT